MFFYWSRSKTLAILCVLTSILGELLWKNSHKELCIRLQSVVTKQCFTWNIFYLYSKRPPFTRGLSLWMWGVKEKDMGGFRHYIKTPLILLSGDNTVILPLLIACHWLVIKFWNTNTDFSSGFFCFFFYRI